MGRARTLAGTAGQSLGMRNRIINGDMRIDQRNAGAVSAAVAGAYSVDRFIAYANGGGAYTTQRSTDVPTGQGFSYSLLSTVTTPSTPTSTAYYLLGQIIEGLNTTDLAWGTANAQAVTLSFWVKSNLTGIYTVSFRNAGFSRAYRATYTINTANTWEKKTITVPGDTSGTWTIDNGPGVRVLFTVGAGSTYINTGNSWSANDGFAATGQTQWIATAGANLYIAGVQLEKGETATPFEFRPYGQELALCQRYYEQETMPMYVQGEYAMGAYLNYGYANMPFKTSKRAEPSVSLVYGGSIDNAQAATMSNVGTSGFVFTISIVSFANYPYARAVVTYKAASEL